MVMGQTLKERLAACQRENAKLRGQAAVGQSPVRSRLPDTRKSVTRTFRLPLEDGVVKIYATVGMYEDGRPGELFINADKSGSLARGALDATAMAVSVGLQYGIPLSVFVDKLVNMRFEPNGLTGDKEYPVAASVLDLVARWLRDLFPLVPTEGE